MTAGAPRSIAIVTDAWMPQVNGVVRTLTAIRHELERRGHRITIVSPDLFPTMACPGYAEIRLALASPGQVGDRIAASRADAVHLATEGPLCLAARQWCVRRGVAFTTAYHTNFPDYVAGRTGVPARWLWPYFRWFHGGAEAVLASTPSVRRRLAAEGIGHSRPWGRGVDLALFRPDGPRHAVMAALPRPVLLHVGRVAPEKNIGAFLGRPLAGTKVVVGDGPARGALQARHPGALFLGTLSGAVLASAYRAADALVFPSRTDTFGLVLVEAMACGTPVAAYPVPGPLDVVPAAGGCLDEDLGRAVAGALTRDRAACAAHGRGFDWGRSADEFLAALHPLRRGPVALAA